jgi:glycogen debranching enzyme
MINYSIKKSKKISTTVSELTEYLLPFLFRGTDYLGSRDEDNDGLLEQDHNEDWMDTVLRKGKVVYSQACWLMALTSFSNLLFVLDKETEAQKLRHVALQLVNSIENRMWSEKDRCYVDIKLDKSADDDPPSILYQDIVFYIFAMTELLPHILPNMSQIGDPDMCSIDQENESLINNGRAMEIKERLLLALGSLKNRTWLGDIPLVTEKPLLKTGPWILQSNEYHNYTYWPWITSVELLTRFRFGQIDECNLLLSNLFNHSGQNSKSNNDNIFYEWLNPTTKTGGGAYPFRTGISAFRLTLFEIISKVQY